MGVAFWMSDLLWNSGDTVAAAPRLPLSMIEIARLRSWLRNDHGLETTLVIERRGDRNWVALRFFLSHGTGELEAGWLRDLRKKALGRTITRQRLEQKLREREGEADTRTVA